VLEAVLDCDEEPLWLFATPDAVGERVAADGERVVDIDVDGSRCEFDWVEDHVVLRLLRPPLIESECVHVAGEAERRGDALSDCVGDPTDRVTLRVPLTDVESDALTDWNVL
jgi:hypothetical protein